MNPSTLEVSDRIMNRRPIPDTVWRSPAGEVVSCVEKLKVLRENLEEIQQICQDALEDAVLMGCDERQFKQILGRLVQQIENPYREKSERSPSGSPCEKTRPDRERHERGERPLRNAEREQRPVDRTAFSRAAQDAAQPFDRPEGRKQIIERGAAGGPLLRRQVLQPHVPPRDHDADRRDESDDPAVEPCPEPARGVMKGSDEERDADCKKQNALDDAQGTGLQPGDELQVIAEGEHSGTDEKPDQVSDSP